MRRTVSYTLPATLPAEKKSRWDPLGGSAWRPVRRLEAKSCLSTPWMHWWSGGTVPLILSLGNRWGEWSASRAGRFTPGQRQSVIIVLQNRWRPHSRSECLWEEINLLLIPGIEPRVLGRCRLCEGNEICFHFKEWNSYFWSSKGQASHFLIKKSGHDAHNSCWKTGGMMLQSTVHLFIIQNPYFIRKLLFVMSWLYAQRGQAAELATFMRPNSR